jgi:hypothetical protein
MANSPCAAKLDAHARQTSSLGVAVDRWKGREADPERDAMWRNGNAAKDYWRHPGKSAACLVDRLPTND